MKKALAYLFEREKTPLKGLTWYEWAMLTYVVFTTALIFFMHTRLADPSQMLWFRTQAVAMTTGLWLVYRLFPCRLTMFFRVSLQTLLLSLWYPDVYELNRSFACLDHLFASWEQQLFGCQPALLFSQQFPGGIVSELVELGYAAYYPMIGLVLLWYFFYCYESFERCAFIILASFFTYYVVYIFLPVVGPQYYYLAVGMDEIAAGHFPDLGHYFADHQEYLPIPGLEGGWFHHLVQTAHDAGERPSAAFPSSHVGVTVVLLFLAWRSRRLFFFLLPLFVLLCLGTVYIYAHYAIDVLGGLLSGALIYVCLALLYRSFSETAKHR